MLITVYGFCT